MRVVTAQRLEEDRVREAHREPEGAPVWLSALPALLGSLILDRVRDTEGSFTGPQGEQQELLTSSS